MRASALSRPAGVGAARLRQVGLAAARAADELRALLHEVARLHLAR